MKAANRWLAAVALFELPLAFEVSPLTTAALAEMSPEVIMEKTKFIFPSTPVPPLLDALAEFAAGCDDFFSGDFELYGTDLANYFTVEAATQLAVFGHDGMDSLFGFWLYHGRIDEAPVVYINSEGCDSTVLANSLPEFLGLLGRNYELLGFYKEWREPDEPANQETHARFLDWLKAQGIQVPVDPRSVVKAARKAHPDLDDWVTKHAAEASKRRDGERGVTPLDKELCEAAQKGKVEEVKRLLSQGASPTAPGDYEPVLHEAAAAGHLGVVRALLDAGAPASLASKYGYTPLHRAAEDGRTDVVRLLLARGASVDQTAQHMTALTKASEKGREDSVRLLLEHGASVDPPADFEFNLPLARAAREGHAEICQLLLDRGARLTRDTFIAAAQGGLVRVLQAGLDAGFSANETAGRQSVLVSAAWAGAVEAVRWLLDHGADPNLRNPDGQTPLGAAAHGVGDTLGAMSLLLERGADPNLADADESNAGRPMHNAVFSSNAEDVIRLLVKHGADVSLKDARGRTSLQLAPNKRVKDLLRELRDKAAKKAGPKRGAQKAGPKRGAQKARAPRSNKRPSTKR